jgi:hypothetical protein
MLGESAGTNVWRLPAPASEMKAYSRVMVHEQIAWAAAMTTHVHDLSRAGNVVRIVIQFTPPLAW